MKKEKIFTLLGLIVLMITCFLISYFMLLNQSITLDEAQSINQALLPVPQLMVYMAHDVNTFLYILILHFWMQFFGTGIVQVRLLSLIFMLVSIPVVYKVYKESSNRNIAIIAIVFFSLSPFIIWYSSIARTYTLFILATGLSHLYFLRLMKSNGEKGKLGYFLSSVLGIYVHYFFIFLIFSQGLYILWRTFINYKEENLRYRFFMGKQLLLKYFTLLFLWMLVFLPWLWFVYKSGLAYGMTPLIEKPTSYTLFASFSDFIFGFQPLDSQALLITAYPLLSIVILLVFTRKYHARIKNLSYFAFITFFPILLIYLISYIYPILLDRYLIFTLPSLFFLITIMLTGYGKKATSILVSGFFIILVGSMVIQNISYDSSAKEDYFGATQYLNTHVTPQDIIAVSAPFTVYPVEYFYTGNSEIDTIPQWNQFSSGGMPIFTLKGLQQQMNDYKKVYQNIYILFSYNQGSQEQIINYLDTHYQREKLINYTYGMQLREYKLRYN